MLFTVFYLVLFVTNRMQHISTRLENENQILLHSIDTIHDIGLFVNEYQVVNFVDYALTLDRFYGLDFKDLQHILDENTMYASVAIIDGSGNVVFKGSRSANLPFKPSNDFLSRDSVKTTIKFYNFGRDTYKVFSYPMSSNSDLYVVAYLDLELLYGIEDIYVISRDGRILNKPLPDRYTTDFVSSYPDEWNYIVNNHDGQHITKNGIFTYRTLNTAKMIRGIKVNQDSYYLLSFIPMDEDNDPYHISDLASFIKHADFKVNIVYWVIGYIWIFFISIAMFLIIVNRLASRNMQSLDEKFGILDRVYGLTKIKKLSKEMRISGPRRLLIYIICLLFYFRRPIYSMYFCKIYIDGLKQIFIGMDNHQKDNLMAEIIHDIKQGLSKENLVVRISVDEFLVVFVNHTAQYVSDYYDTVSSLICKKNENNRFKYRISLSHGVVEYNSKSSITGCISKASAMLHKEKKMNDINLFFN